MQDMLTQDNLLREAVVADIVVSEPKPEKKPWKPEVGMKFRNMDHVNDGVDYWLLTGINGRKEYGRPLENVGWGYRLDSKPSSV